MFAAFLATFCFSISAVCGTRAARLIGGIEANFWRLALAAFFLSLWAFTGGNGLGGGALPIFLLSGLIGIGIGDAALFEALPRLGSRLSVLLIQCGTAPIAAVVEWLWLGTTLGAVQILCVTIILAGVAAALSPNEHLHIPRTRLGTGILFALVGAAGNGLGAVLSRKGYAIAFANHEPMDGGTAGFQRLLGGLLIAGVLLLVTKRHFLRLPEGAGDLVNTAGARDKWRRIWPWVLANSLAGQTVGMSLMLWALKTTPTGIVTAVTALTPLVVIPFARVMENEKVTPRALIGGAIAVAGVVGLAIAR
jgi:drug/metabolite transporter (DMT)-like permease